MVIFIQTVTKRNIFKNSIAHVGKITNLVLMCSITNNAHSTGRALSLSSGLLRLLLPPASCFIFICLRDGGTPLKKTPIKQKSL